MITAPYDFTDLAPTTGIEFAAVEGSKVPETLIAQQAVAWAGSWMAAGKTCLVVAPRVESLQRTISSWCASSLLHGTIKVVKPDLKWDDLPWEVARVVIVDAHLMPKEPFVAAAEVYACGHKADAGTPWAAFLARAAQSVQVPFADMPWAVAPAMEPDAARRLLALEDYHPRPVAFLPFARNRLFVRTDKSSAYLAADQQKTASGQQGTPIVAMHASVLQRRYLAMKRMAIKQGKPARFLLLKYRRGGFTTVEQASSYHLAVTRPRSQIVTLAHTADSTKRIFRMVSLFHELDPAQPKLVSDSSSYLEFAHNASLFFVGTAGGKGFGRGDTLQRVHGSEVSKWCDGNEERVADLVAGVTEACAQGEVVLETTPNGIEWFAQKYKEAKAGRNDWTPLFLAWYMDPGNFLPGFEWPHLEPLDDKEAELVKQFKLAPGQIAFRRSKKRELGKLFPQEYPEDDESCFIVSGTPFFDYEQVVAMQGKLGLAVEKRKHIPGGYETRWEEPIKGVEYVAGADCSEGLTNCDLNGVAIMRKDTGAQVAVVHGLFNPRELAKHCARICTEYNEALLGVERENYGHAVLSNLIALGYGKPHYKGGPLFYIGEGRMVDDMDREAKAGWSTNAITRPILLDDIAEWMETPGFESRIKHREFLSECLTFRKQGSGRWDHDTGCHDDTIFMWAIANQMRKQRKRKVGLVMVSRG